MQLTINDKLHTLIPIQTFRADLGLPESFGVAYFEPKNWEGLASLEGSGPALALVKQRVIKAVEPQLTFANLMTAVAELTRTFENELNKANVNVGLRQVEVDFAVAGFHDILQAVTYRLIQLGHGRQQDAAQGCRQFDFSSVYQTWLDDSVRISTVVNSYTHNNSQIEARIINNAYGRVGLEVKVDATLFYVMDTALACPASGFMRDLGDAVAQALCQALSW